MLYFWIEDITIYERSRELVINRILPEKMEITAVDGVESIFVYFFAILGLFAASLVWFISVPVGLLILLLFILRKARRKMKGM